MRIAYISSIFSHIYQDDINYLPNLLDVYSGIKEESVRLTAACDFFFNDRQIKDFFQGHNKTDDYSCVGLGLSNLSKTEMQNLQRILPDTPLINLINRLYYPGENYIGTDSRMGMKLLVDHLYAEGHRNIAFINTKQRVWAVERFNAFKECMQMFALPVKQELMFGMNIQTGNLVHDENHSDFLLQLNAYWKADTMQTRIHEKFITELAEQADAVICTHDSTACGLIRMAEQYGISVPHDLAVTGYGNAGFQSDFIDLTSIDQNYYNTGKIFARTAYEMHKGKRKNRNQLIFLEPQLKRRHSSLRKSLESIGAGDIDLCAKISNYLENNISDDNIQEVLSNYLAVSRDYLLKKFRNLFESDMQSYINQLRIKKSCFLLKETSKPVSEILFEVGYNNKRTFNLNFKRIMQVTPLVYRKKNSLLDKK